MNGYGILIGIIFILLTYLFYKIFQFNEPENIEKEGNPELAICPKCGSTDIEHSNMGYGIHQPGGGAPTNIRCNKCEYMGIQIILDNKVEHRKYLNQIKENKE